VVEMFKYFSEIGDGVISAVDVQHGLPFRMTLERTE
jgi:hypothetical protein